ncbi:hypothetical protein Bca101_097211 [Brassica carinata]
MFLTPLATISTSIQLLGFGLRLSLFEDAERLVSDASEKKHLKSCIEQAKEQLTEVDHQPTVRSQGYLFEGHLTVDREPPQPQCLVQQNLMSAFSSIVAGESSNAADILEDGGPPRAPLASKEVVKKLLVIVFSEEMLKTTSITLALYAAMSYQQMIRSTRAGKRGRKRPRKRGKAHRMLSVEANICIKPCPRIEAAEAEEKAAQAYAEEASKILRGRNI